MQNITITIDGVTKKLELIDMEKSGERSTAEYLINRQWYREVEEKDYEILSFRSTLSNGIVIWELTKQGVYFSEGMLGTGHSLELMLGCVKENSAVIYSVKRLSDNEVFTVGEDDIDGKITEFLISGDSMWYRTARSVLVHLNNAEKVKPTTPKVLLTTEDGKEITDVYQKVNGLTIEFIKFECNATYTNQPKESKYYNSKYFSTSEARDEYILQNKPVTVTLTEWVNSSNGSVRAFFKSKQK